jgi:hypothetical protein
MEILEPELLRKLLRYEPETGKLFWLPRGKEFFKADCDCVAWNARFANREAFTASNRDGYKIGKVLRKGCLAHRLIWVMQTSADAISDIDHIDRNPANNKWLNLRLATRSENQANRASSRDSTSKYLGVHWHKRDKRWEASIQRRGKRTGLGYFHCELEAARCYDIAAMETHGSFANLNFPKVTAQEAAL